MARTIQDPCGQAYAESALRTSPLPPLSRSDLVHWQILLQKSPQNCRKAKTSSNRIRTSEHLNQYCELKLDLESMLLARTLKILLQQYRHEAGGYCDAASRPLLKVLRTRNARGQFVSPMIRSVGLRPPAARPGVVFAAGCAGAGHARASGRTASFQA
jgi:hypothetical protein